MGAAESNPVVTRLESMLCKGDIPAPYDRWGARLLAHLSKPVQVVVTGLAGTGKSALIEMMAAQPVLGDKIVAPITELVFGDAERTQFERADGSFSAGTGLLKNSDCPDDVICARQELPDKSLLGRSFIEIGLRGDPSHMQAILNMAVERADVIIWCSQSFSAEEQRLWSSVPDHIKDNSLLVLTMADRQMMRGVLNDNIDRISPIVAEEFLGLFPVATIQGTTAQTAGETTNEALWASSGGKPLMDLVNKQITLGRSADIDRASLFLEKLTARIQPTATAPVSTETSPVNELPVQSQDSTAVAREDTTGIDQSFDDDAENSAQTISLLSEAADLLRQHASTLLEKIDSSGELDPDTILNGCSEAMSSLIGLIESVEDQNAVTRSVRDDMEEGEEMLMLFQLERGEEAALDAVTLLLQIRNELIEKTTD